MAIKAPGLLISRVSSEAHLGQSQTKSFVEGPTSLLPITYYLFDLLPISLISNTKRSVVLLQ